MKRINFSLLMLTFTLFSIYKSSHSDDISTPDVSFHRSLNCLLVSQPAKSKTLDLTIGINGMYVNAKNTNSNGECAYSILAQELHRNFGPRFSETKQATM